MDDRLIRAREVSQLTGFAIGTLANFRWAKTGPPFYKLHGRIRYRWSEVIDWIEKTSAVTLTDESVPYDDGGR